MFRKFSTMLVLLFTGATILSAQNVDEIINKSIASRGDTSKFTKSNTLKITGTITQMAMNIPFTFYMKGHKMYRMESEMMGAKSILVYNGDSLWVMTQGKTQSVPPEYHDKVLPQIKQVVGFLRGPLLSYKEKDREIEFSGNVTEDGRDSYTLKMVDKDDNESYLYIDKKNNELFKIWGQIENAKGELTDIEFKYSDYKDENGFTVPHTFSIKVGDQGATVFHIEKVEYDPQIEDSVFAKPAEG